MRAAIAMCVLLGGCEALVKPDEKPVFDIADLEVHLAGSGACPQDTASLLDAPFVIDHLDYTVAAAPGDDICLVATPTAARVDNPAANPVAMSLAGTVTACTADVCTASLTVTATTFPLPVQLQALEVGSSSIDVETPTYTLSAHD